MSDTHTVLFAGGGSGGHIFPNIAILEQLRAQGVDVTPHFLVSDRKLDHRLMNALKFDYTPLLVEPMPTDLLLLWRFYKRWKSSIKDVDRVLEDQDVAACVATGGFVSGPVVKACAAARVPVVVVNLDSVPGKATKYCAKYATTMFSAYDKVLSRAHYIGLPLRRSSIGAKDKGMARKKLGLDPALNTLLVVGGSQGSASLNTAIGKIMTSREARLALVSWQIMHITGGKGTDQLKSIYQKASIPSLVVDFCSTMGLAYTAANLSVCRAGAGTVAEVWANTLPSIFVPYPYHADDHQKFNAKPLTDAGGALIVDENVDNVEDTAARLGEALLALIGDEARRAEMSKILNADRPKDGATEVASWLALILQG